MVLRAFDPIIEGARRKTEGRLTLAGKVDDRRFVIQSTHRQTE
jgi:hypothetical protein